MCVTHCRPVSERSLGLSGVRIYIDDENVKALIKPRTQLFQAGGLHIIAACHGHPLVITCGCHLSHI
jgi:hypothetical protein